MHQKRNWQSWPKRMKDEVNSTSGLFGLAGAGVAGIGLVSTAPIVIGAGAVLTGGMVLYSAYRAIPPALPMAKSVIGERLYDLAMLDQMHPPPTKVGFVGISQSGKTTLLSRISANPAPTSERTDRPYADVTCLAGAPDDVFALIDAAGQQYSQQFRVVDQCDNLIVILDHNSSATSKDLDPSRISNHEDFLVQIAGHISNSEKKVRSVCILINKRDNWADGPDARAMQDWADKCQQSLNMVFGIRLSVSYHSNFQSQDISSLVSMLRQWN